MYNTKTAAIGSGLFTDSVLQKLTSDGEQHGNQNAGDYQ